MKKQLTVRKLCKSDWQEVKSIYIQGIETDNATFEDPSNIKGFEHWIDSKIEDSCYVMQGENNQILGWSALSFVNDRCVYTGVAEVSVYVALNAQRMGVGKSLLAALIDYAEQNNIWTLQASILPENQPSIGLHKKLGFKIVGVREKISKLKGKWRDTVLVERRSKSIF